MFCLPVVCEADYPALRANLASAIPATYDGWLKMLAELKRAHSQEGVAHLTVDPAEFAGYMRNAGRKLDLQALLEFAAFNPWQEPDA